MTRDPQGNLEYPDLAKTALIRELVDLSRFTERILRTLDSGVMAVDEEGRVAYVNPAAEEILGRSAAELLHTGATDLLPTRGGGNLLAEVPRGGGSGEIDLELPGGRRITVDVRLSHQESADGHGWTVAILTDRTELKRAEENARRKERLASLGELSAGVAHEIRNPLAGIGASAQLLRNRLEPTDDRGHLVKLILEEVARLDRIVEGLLKFARPAQPSLRKGDLDQCVKRAQSLIAEDATRAGIRVQAELGEGLPAIWIDPDQVVQVLLNLCQNAVQAMEEKGEGVLVISVRRVSRRAHVRRRAGRRSTDAQTLTPGRAPLREWVEIEIRDTGDGISPEARERAFNPFYTTRKRGTGLGLPICQAIVQEHGGTITLQSEPGRGTSALVTLPVDKRGGGRRREG